MITDYQLVAYASRYRCKRVALVYPASIDCPPGLVDGYTLAIPNAPSLEIYALDVRALCFGGSLPANMLPADDEPRWMSPLTLALGQAHPLTTYLPPPQKRNR